MALITGGMGGLGMVASYEHAMAGRDKIIAVTRSAYLTPGEQEAHLLDVIQDICTHYVIRCDIADAGAWTDALAFANNISPHDDYDPQATMKDAGSLLKSMDSLDVIDVLVASLRGMIEAGTPIDAPKLDRVLFFRNNMSRGLGETLERCHGQAVDHDTQERLFQFQESLRELSELIELFRKRGLVEERPGAADAGPMGGIFPSEAAATARQGVQAERTAAPPSAAPSAASSGEADRRKETPAKDSLLELLEKELTASKRSKPAAQGGASGLISNLDSMGDVVPGQSQPRGSRPADGPAPSPEQPAAKEAAAEAKPPPPAAGACGRCGKECAASCAHCSDCQRLAERGALEGAIRRAKEEARLKAQRDAERKAQRQEAERRAQEEAQQRVREAAERKAREEGEQRAREEAQQRARAEAERRALAAAAREADEEAARREADRHMQAAQERKALDDIVCPQGHALERFTAQRGFPCDLCDTESVDGASMWGCRNKNGRDCRTCDFDICAQCSKGRSRRQLRAQGEVA